MKHAKKLWALALALVMALALGVTAWATGSVVVPGGNNPLYPGNEMVVQFTIVKKVVKAENAATPPAETFEFVLEDTANEKKSPADYGIKLLDELKIETDGAKDDYSKEIRAAIDMSKVNPNGGWEVITPVGSQNPSSYYKTFHITEKNSGKDGWDYSTAKYAVTFKYDCDTGSMTCGVYQIGNDVTYRTADFTNTYTKQADPTTTVEIPFTKVVKLGDNANADKQTFELEIFNIGNSNTSEYANVTYTAKVETNGEGTYTTGKLVITGPADEVEAFTGEGFYVREKNTKADNWTYSDAVWYVNPDLQNGLITYPATKRTSDNGDYYEIGDAAAMSFTNIYTRHVSHTRTETTETKIESPKTFDAGIGLYAVSALLSVIGSAWLMGKKRK